MKCVILQPSYVPWRGYFDQIHAADVFVFYDDVQYDRRGWRNRNRIKTPHGTQWITIPTKNKGNIASRLRIDEVEILPVNPWARKHYQSIVEAYRKAPHFAYIEPLLEAMFAEEPTMLAPFTMQSTIEIARLLGIEHTRFERSSQIGIQDEPTPRLVKITKAMGCDHYISGPSARDYLDESLFADAGIKLEYMRYDYPEYEQLYPPYDPHVSILDLLAMKGPEAGEHIWGHRSHGV